MIISTLKENGIEAYGQDLGDARFASVRYGMEEGVNDRVAIYVAAVQKGHALQVIKELGL